MRSEKSIKNRMRSEKSTFSGGCMRRALEDVRIFQERRRRLAELMQGAALIVGSPAEAIRNGSQHFPFRQDSNLYYLTGFEEPESIFVFVPGGNPESILFCRKRDLTRETWDGFRFGPEGAQQEFRLDACYPIEEFSSQIVRLIKSVDRVYYRAFRQDWLDEKVSQALLGVQMATGRSGFGLLPILDSNDLMGELRVKKGAADLANQREACEVSALAHKEVMKYVRPGLNEREVHGFFLYQIMKRGAAREGYNGIVAGGSNACTLHYIFNDEVLRGKDLLLLDAGAEVRYFTGDITRTYPVSAKFSDDQREVYQGVLSIQKELIQMVKPGLPFQHLHDRAAELLADLMLELGLLSGRREEILKSNDYRRYYPHGIGHFLGMDVHDLGMYFDRKTKEPRRIEPGMVFTIEPGLYIPANDEHRDLAGIGVRIEDNILVTENGHEVLTVGCPKEVADLEAIIGSG